MIFICHGKEPLDQYSISYLLIIIFKVHAAVSNHSCVVGCGTVLGHRPHGKEHNALQSGVVEEVVEGPEAPIL